MISDELKDELSTMSKKDLHSLYFNLRNKLSIAGIYFSEEEAKEIWVDKYEEPWSEAIWAHVQSHSDWIDLVSDSIFEDLQSRVYSVIVDTAEELGFE